LQLNYKEAKEIIDTPTPDETFRREMRQSIRYAMENGLESDEDIEKLVVQICYRAADLSYLLKIRNQKLSEDRPDSLTVEIFLEDDTEAFASTLCTNTVQPRTLGAEEVTPQTVTVELRWNNEKIRKTFTPDYVNFRPNGRGCPPVCAQAFIEIDVTAD
jgi:hypothetical protein